MANDDHYAILLTINRYPGLSDLNGPENDGKDFAAWLLDPRYGNLPDDPEHICRIHSSDFTTATDPYDALPTELELKRVLNRWLMTSDGWHDRIGERLYLFFAGHGFTAGSHINDPALFSAVAQSNDTAHIAVFRYASKIANAGFFDEIVLVTDFCQDVLKASQVHEPSWKAPDRQRTGDVRLFQAYGAPRGRKSFERDIGPDGASRGLFSSVLMEALRNAPAEDDGWVTDRTVKDLFLELWAQRYQRETGYVPPLRPPDSGRIRFYRRQASAPGDPLSASAPPRVAVDLRHVISRSSQIERDAADGDAIPPSPAAPPDPPGRRPRLKSADLRALHSTVLDLEPGLHVVVTPDGQPDIAFEVPPPSSGADDGVPVPEPVAVPSAHAGAAHHTVVLASDQPGAAITVLDAGYAMLGSSIDRVSLSLPAGVYKARVGVGATLAQSLFTVADAPLSLTLQAPAFPSAAAVAGTSTTHEYQSYPAAAFVQAPLGVEPGEGVIAIFARDSQHPPGTLPVGSLDGLPPWRRFRIVRLGGEGDAPRALLQEHRDPDGCTFLIAAAAPGSFALLVDRGDVLFGGRDEDGLIVPVIAGWRTEVHLDCLDDADGTRVLDPAGASFHLVRADAPSPLFEPSGLSTEIARAQLAAGHAVAAPDADAAALSPMWALYAAQAARLQRPPRRDTVERCLQAVPAGVREGLSDFALLARWLERPDETRPRDDLPVLAASWQLAAQLPAGAGLAPVLAEAVGQWRNGGSLWTTWRRNADAHDAMREHLRDGLDPARGHAPAPAPALEPECSLATWAGVAAGLRRPARGHSPFQQALRRQLLDALAEGDPAGVDVFALAREFMLSPDYAARAYGELYRHASDARFDLVDSVDGAARWQSLDS